MAIGSGGADVVAVAARRVVTAAEAMICKMPH
jgi:hypothetical protein